MITSPINKRIETGLNKIMKGAEITSALTVFVKRNRQNKREINRDWHFIKRPPKSFESAHLSDKKTG